MNFDSLSSNTGIVKMWRYLTVSKVSSDKNTDPPRGYEKTTTRKFSLNWQVGCPWLQNDWASENWSGRVQFEGHSPRWRVRRNFSSPTLHSRPSVLFKAIVKVLSNVALTCSKVPLIRL